MSSVENSYAGPRLEDGKVTVQFMNELMEWFKNQKVLHHIERYLMSQPTLIDVTIPDDKEFTVCGDIHGQYYDPISIIFSDYGTSSLKIDRLR
ncbi:Serine/threonine-protein phosphatase 5 [Orchesella cincta]|uniref:protein-serine/threonine phosphatase n=1 Tax=Orchesella cincta TaxID=48709 RepID=A0A1D2NKR7_ORCCI|nr:Serine/threonine-protein phosphatase 5 [Orchesella cincta]